MTLWSKLIEIIDDFYMLGFNKITRKALIKYFYPGRKWNELPWTVDNYRRYLTKAGYLITLRPGVYKILKSPMGKTLFEVKFEAYPISIINEILSNQKRFKELFNFKDKLYKINRCEYYLENLIDQYGNKIVTLAYIKRWVEFLRNKEINRVKDCIGINI